MSGVRSGRVAKVKRRLKSRPVLRMMAIMQDENNGQLPKEFVEGGRTGRRNAMPDILHPPGVQTSTADLPARLQQLVTTECECRRKALPQLPRVKFQDAAVNVDPSVWLDRSAEDKSSAGSLLTDSVGSETDPPGKDVTTADPVCPSNPTKSGPEVKSQSLQAPAIPDRHHVVDVIRLNDAVLREMLGDPDNPQPGPSTSQPESQKTDETQKKDSAS